MDKRVFVFLSLFVILLFLGEPAVSLSKPIELESKFTETNKEFSPTCGGAVQCNCGDTLIDNYIMTSDLFCLTENAPGGFIIPLGVENIILDCNGHSIVGNLAYTGQGIVISEAKNITIKNCKIRNFYLNGIRLGGTSLYPVSSKILNNSFSNNHYGVVIGQYVVLEIENNTFLSNDVQGIETTLLHNGGLIKGNIFDSNLIGFRMNADNYMIRDNFFKNNVLYGILGHPNSAGNKIYNNHFANQSIHVMDEGNNFWNTTKINETNIMGGKYIAGNYWDDYLGIDNNGDGLGDTEVPYNNSGNIISGGDYAPLVERETLCNNGCIDDDNDGLINCQDPDCSEDETCQILPVKAVIIGEGEVFTSGAPSESDISGNITGRICRDSYESGTLLSPYLSGDHLCFKHEECESPQIDKCGFANGAIAGDEHTCGEDRLMQPSLIIALNELEEYATCEGLYVRITEAYDSLNEHSPNSLHYEGRALDITQNGEPFNDPQNLSRIMWLANKAGFDYVYYENSLHLHVSKAGSHSNNPLSQGCACSIAENIPTDFCKACNSGIQTIPLKGAAYGYSSASCISPDPSIIDLVFIDNGKAYCKSQNPTHVCVASTSPQNTQK